MRDPGDRHLRSLPSIEVPTSPRRLRRRRTPARFSPANPQNPRLRPWRRSEPRSLALRVHGPFRSRGVPALWDVGFEGLVGGAGGYAAAIGNQGAPDERMSSQRRCVDRPMGGTRRLLFGRALYQMGPSEDTSDFFVPRAGKHPETGSTRPVDHASSASTAVHSPRSVYVPPEKASMERVTSSPTGLKQPSACWCRRLRPLRGRSGASVESSRRIRAICEHVEFR